jgi:predicted nucleic acid-binding protein
MEIEVGVKPGEEARTAECLDGLTVLPVDGELAREAAALLRKRKRLEPREWVDALIAATAIRHGLTLVTYNRRDYPYSEVSLHPV